MEVLTLGEAPHDTAAGRAAEVLAAGGLVIFPTETVYGLAVRGDDDEARARLCSAKGRDADKPVAWYVTSARDVEALLGREPSRPVRRLMRALWPGPLTVVLAGADGTTTGFRCSSHPFVPEMLHASAVPVVGTSANLSGQPPLTSASELEQTFAGTADLLVAAGADLQGRASTVVLVGHDGAHRIVREGDVAADVIASELTTSWLFICTGNTCRSPLARVMLEELAREREVARSDGSRHPHRALSAGTGAFPGLPASDQAREVARELGLDLRGHRAAKVTTDLIASADLVFTMTRDQCDVLAALCPAHAGRIRPLAGRGRDIADPFGGSLEQYRRCAQEIRACLEQRLEQGV